MKNLNIALVGATGYLGSYISKELNQRGFNQTILTRRIDDSLKANNIYKVDFNSEASLLGKLLGVDVLISTVGITKQKDGLTYMDVDYQINSNLLKEAKRSGVKKFIFVSVLNGDKIKDVKIIDAKEKFVKELKESGLDYCIVRPNGFFSDLKEFCEVAKKGRVYLFGDGGFKLNPIHGEDLAKVCTDMITQSSFCEIEVGGPKIYSQNDIAKVAFETVGKKQKITHIPDCIRVLSLKLLPFFISEEKFGPIEFFMSISNIDMVAPKYGKHTLEEFFKEINK